MQIIQPRGALTRCGLAGLGVAALAAGEILWTTTAMASLPTTGYAELVERVSPAVVFISSTQKAPKADTPSRGEERLFPFPPGSPFEEFFKQFRGEAPAMRRPMTALGSGFIIDASGDIVTNNHVIDGASKVRVKLQDGREYTAKVVGTDRQTDLALLKITADKPLPFVRFGDSSKARPGDVVLAVGNPFGLGGTVTAGIISARNRDINAGPYDDYIQTDAAINHGNSGGPLFNTSGDVIGINTAIYSPNGGSVGIGFAVPANLAKHVANQLKEHGAVSRGWLGVKIQTVSPEMAQALQLDGDAKGAVVAEVTEDSPAAKAGLRQGDVILSYDGNAIKTMRDLPRLVANTRAGDTARVEVWRDGKKMSLSTVIAPFKTEQLASTDTGGEQPGTSASRVLGAQLAALDEDIRTRLNLPDDVKGVVIARIDPEGRAAASGLRSGDVIVKVSSDAVRKPADVDRVIAGAQGKAVLLLINRGGEEMFVGIRLADA
jgi:serine protease Do